jgi:hypothetical protein
MTSAFRQEGTVHLSMGSTPAPEYVSWRLVIIGGQMDVVIRLKARTIHKSQEWQYLCIFVWSHQILHLMAPLIGAAQQVILRWRILFRRQIYSRTLQKHPLSASWTPKISSPHQPFYSWRILARILPRPGTGEGYTGKKGYNWVSVSQNRCMNRV